MSKCRYNLSKDCYGRDCVMCVIEDIKAEIQQTLEVDWSDGLYRALRIIEKHTSGAKMESEEQE